MLFGRKKRHITRILVVEDEPLVAFDTEYFLTASGFEIAATVDSVADALRVIEGGTEVDLVLADVNLADGSGVDVARTAHGRGIPVLLVTGACPEGARVFAAGCLAKPYPQKDLLGAINAIGAVIGGEKLPNRLPSGFNLFDSAA
ncbi:response regulator [Sphingomonas sp. Leaf407]|uniref:response regulator n=1 Tax=unclassified Sphingomonas TaxID=196159 RepID=UPI0006FD6D19|nr:MULTISPECIES: response regulator [unclassified Sphingomonas]KQN40466.1 response regulator [Sphingomonas sp. Leaf42]KQT29821.1 response regulator [Sphingomonas sp. Leaf407]